MEQRAGRMDGDHLCVYKGAVALLRVLLGGIAEESGANTLLDAGGTFPTGYDVQFMPNTKFKFKFKFKFAL